MKVSLQLFRGSSRRHGWALLAVLALSAVGIMVLAGVMNWANENATVAGRNNEYFATSYAAEAATEKVLANHVRAVSGFWVCHRLQQHVRLRRRPLPTASDDAYWSSYHSAAAAPPTSSLSPTLRRAPPLSWASLRGVDHDWPPPMKSLPTPRTPRPSSKSSALLASRFISAPSPCFNSPSSTRVTWKLPPARP